MKKLYRQRSLYTLIKKSKLFMQKCMTHLYQSMCFLIKACALKIKHSLHRNSFSGKSRQENRRSDIFNALLNSYRLRLALLLLLLALPGIIIKAYAMEKQSLQPEIADKIIRFHVIANSDSAEDQALKLTVKNALVEALAPCLIKASSKEAARELLLDELSSIENLAMQIILQKGYSYPVRVSLEECYFPLKLYGEYSFPPGYYEALRVEIGSAAGKNWWCVMFPPLCFVDECYSIVDESSGNKLQQLLTEEEFEVLKVKKIPVKIKFKLLELIKSLFN